MKPLKTLLLWILLLAIPLQGWAGNTVSICKASHQRVAHLAVPDHGTHHGLVRHDMSHRQQQHADDHAHHHAVQQEDSGTPSLHHGDGDTNQQLSSCSACSACSVGALWLPGAEMTVAPSIASSSPIFYLSFHVPGIDPDRPDHPPRAFLV